VTVHYNARLLDGTLFDSSYQRGSPARLRIRQVISGWNAALLAMKKGEKRLLIIPPEPAYGERGYPGVIPSECLPRVRGGAAGLLFSIDERAKKGRLVGVHQARERGNGPSRRGRGKAFQLPQACPALPNNSISSSTLRRTAIRAAARMSAPVPEPTTS